MGFSVTWLYRGYKGFSGLRFQGFGFSGQGFWSFGFPNLGCLKKMTSYMLVELPWVSGSANPGFSLNPQP